MRDGVPEKMFYLQKLNAWEVNQKVLNIHTSFRKRNHFTNELTAFFRSEDTRNKKNKDLDLESFAVPSLKVLRFFAYFF